MSQLIRLVKVLLPYVVLLGGLIILVCAQPPLQYVGLALYLLMFVYALIESHLRYHPRQEK